MSYKIIAVSLIFVLIMILILFRFIKTEKISIKYSMVWFLALFIIILSCIFQKPMIFLSKLIGFQTMSNFVFSLLFAIIIMICISLTIIVTTQKKQIRMLVQELSIMKSELNNNEKK